MPGIFVRAGKPEIQLSGENATPSSVISVLVTEIQPAQVLGLKESVGPADAGPLDPRHKGEEDGGLCKRIVPQMTCTMPGKSRCQRSETPAKIPGIFGRADKPEIQLSGESATPPSVISVLVTEIQPAQVLGLKDAVDPADAGSLDPRHKGGEDEEWDFPKLAWIFKRGPKGFHIEIEQFYRNCHPAKSPP